jgi:sulfite reductase (ferredoxin)
MPVATGNAGTRRKRGEGQWALGYREPLNKNEENKRNDDGLNVRQRIIDTYSKNGFDSIDPADLRGRFRWYGLYTQRRPGIDGGKTAVLEPEELDDRYFMLRVRIDGGQLSNDQLRVIGYISRRYARGTADVTDRQNIQLHWIEIENVPDIWEALESVGLSTTEACGDTPRVMLGCPLAGLDAAEIIDATPEITAIGERYIGDSAFSNLPRKFKSSISGCAAVRHPRDQRHRVRRRGRRQRGNRVRPVGRRRPLHQPDDRQAPWHVRQARPGGRGLGRGGRAVP